MKFTEIDKAFKAVIEQIKNMSRKQKIMSISIFGGVVLFAIILTLFLNSSNSGYVPLYNNLETNEKSTIYSLLSQWGADVQFGSDGNIMVREDEFDIWILQLAAEGYPKTAPTYDHFSSNLGMTTTESERQQWILYQLQSDMRATLKSVDGVADATVIIDMPQTSNYIWDEADEQAKSSASVLLTLDPGVTLDPIQVSAIKNLVAFGVPKMSPEDVAVIDSRQSLELHAENDDETLTIGQNVEFEYAAQSQIEQNIVRLLSPRYGSDGVVATAKVTINYDAMLTEMLELQENPDGDGFVTSTQGSYTLGEDVEMGGLVGEEDNTDFPQYSYSGTDGEDATYFTWDTDIDYSYIKTQIEKGEARLERATVSVLVNEPSLTEQRREELTNLISKSVDIEPDLIFVSGFNFEVADEDDSLEFGNITQVAIIGGISFAGLLIIGLILFLLLRRRAKKAAEQAEIDSQLEFERNKKEIEDYKRQLTADALATENPTNDAIVEEIRDFAKGNPEITANLLRSWLKEGD